ncbi:MAG: O-antigen ligase family protein [Oscillospiraceae bacterium]|nr:O-antigen ligase family protein [Oscillospiraceae bacterium]
MNKKHKSKKEKRLIYPMIPVIGLTIFMIISPLLAFSVKIPITGETTFYLPGRVWEDYCLASREILTFSTGAAFLLFFLGERVYPDKPLKAPLLHSKYIRLPLIFLGVYVLWSIISSVISKYSYVSMIGFPAEPEGLWSVFGCALLFIAAFNYMSYLETEKAQKFISFMIFGATAIIVFMSVIEWFVPMTTLFFDYEPPDKRLALLFGNSINCGVVCAILFSAGTVLCFFEERRLMLAAKIALTVLIFLCVLRSRSSAALYSSLIAAAAGSLTVFIRCKGKILNFLITTAAVAVCAGVYQLAQTGGVTDILNNTGAYDPSNSFMLTDIKAEGNRLFLTNGSGTLELILNDGNLSFEKDGKETSFVQTEDGWAAALDEEYSMVSVILSDELLSLDLGYSYPIYFEITGDVFQYIGLNGYIEEMSDKPPFPEFSDYYRLGTGRVYIWLNTVSMLKDCLFKGYGAGEYVFHYPHADIVGSLNTHGVVPLITPKPHCMYLQIFTSYGFPALVAFICFAALILKRGITAPIPNGEESIIALCAGMICFLISGVANDPNSTFGIWFWVMAGAAEALYEKNISRCNRNDNNNTYFLHNLHSNIVVHNK